MRPTDESERHLESADEAFVTRVRESYRWREPSAMERRAFRARLDERLAERRRPRMMVWAPVALAGAAAVVAAVWLAPPVERAPGIRREPALTQMEPAAQPLEAGTRTAEDALFALTDGTTTLEQDASLPEDYLAISDLFLEGV